MKRFILVLSLLLLVLGCKAPQVITDTIIKDSVIVREKVKFIETPEQNITTPSIHLDSLYLLFRSGVDIDKLNQSISFTDPDSKITGGLKIDSEGNISAQFHKPKYKISYIETETERFFSESINTETTNQPTFWQQAKDILMIILVVIIVVAIFSALRGLGFF